MSLTKYADPGKFEGELALAPLAYDKGMCGCGEEYDFGSDGYVDLYTVCTGPIEPTAEEIAEHELSAEDVAFANNLLGFIVHEDNYGFVSVSWYARGDEVKMAKAVGKLDAAMGEFECEDEGN